MMDPRREALLRIGHSLQRADYRFVAVTPATHRRFVQRRRRQGRARAESIRDALGWNLPYSRETIGDALHELLLAANACTRDDDGWRATVRFSTLDGHLFVHSGFPTDATDAVFFGPDTYRFVDFVRRSHVRARRVVDVGCGSGVGGLMAHAQCDAVVLADVNARALELSRVNAALAGRAVDVLHSDILAGVDGEIDIVIANPPYMLDDRSRTYRDGGGTHGEGVAVRIVTEALERLTPGGTLILYTGAAIVDGVDTFLRAAQPVLAQRGSAYVYAELDPDVFGEELERDTYADVERIAAVGLRATVP